MKNNKAFSLIEISIVLVIIGMITAGVFQGIHLVETAKIKGFANEMNGYKQAVLTFYAVKGYLPGDINRDNRIGQHGCDYYNKNSFSAPYNTNNNIYGIPNCCSGPWVDLFLNKIIEFQPINTNKNHGAYCSTSVASGSAPKSKYIDYFGYLFETGVHDNSFKRQVIVSDAIYLLLMNNNRKRIYLNPLFVEYMDKKFDDGFPRSGNIVSEYTNYELAKTNKQKIYLVYYLVYKP